MISIENNKLNFIHMGLFDRTGEWIHPTVTIDTYEIIFVTDGSVEIYEGTEQYSLAKGDMLILYPNIEHGGTRQSLGHTSFYLLHFKIDDVTALKLPKVCTPDAIRVEKALREIMQYNNKADRVMAELLLARFLIERGVRVERKNKIAHELSEYIRINHTSLYHLRSFR